MSQVIDKLGKLFGSTARVKILRLFLFNPETPYDIDEVASRSKVAKPQARKELKALMHAGFLREKQVTRVIEGVRTIRRKRVKGFFVNPAYPLSEPLKTLLIESELVQVNELPKRFQSAGKIVLFVASGIFTHDPDRSIDILIVGDRIRRNSIDQAVRQLESEIGKEVRYALFEIAEFQYRVKMYDKLLRDVFDFPHIKLIGKLALPQG